jgi:orotidine-5'-phosphate decarboxylase
MPGNKPELIVKYKGVVEAEGAKDYTILSPGLITQGGDVSDAGKAAGDNFNAIVGRDIMGAKNIREKATELTAKL